MKKLILAFSTMILMAPLLAPAPVWAQGGVGAARGVRAGAAAAAISRGARSSAAVRVPAGAALRAPGIPAGVSPGRMTHGGGSGRAALAAQALGRGPAGSPVHGRTGRMDPSQGRYQGLIDPSLLGALAQQYNLPQGGYGYSYDDLYRHLYGHQDRVSRDYRDAAIANAIAGMFGMIVTSAMQPTYAVPVTSAAPVATIPRGPVYESQKVMVREGYYETVQLWVAEYQHPETGDVVEGHHETHRRWVPPVYELRDVRVR